MNIPSAHFLPGTGKQLGNKYVLIDCLGDGTHGWVWRSQRLSDNQVVAVKIPKNISSPDRSLAEGKELIGINPHPNVIEIYDMGRVPPEKEWYAIEMEYFPSESLAQKLERRSHHFGNTYDRLFNIYSQVLEAVGYLAGLDDPISHGDIKPHNILIGQGDHVKLTDFGSSALPEEIYVRTRENGGTVLYSAPEFCDCVSRQGNFEQLLAGDIYSLGVLLYQLTTGRLPHDTQAQVLRHSTFAKPREINSTICAALEDVMLQCLQREPSRRFTSINELKEAFKRAATLQNQQSNVVHLASVSAPSRDWSSEVVDSLAKSEYQKAAALANTEFRRSKDPNALLQELNALYRGERWFDFEKSVLGLDGQYLKIEGCTGAHIRELVVKVFMKLRKLDQAQQVLETAKLRGDLSFELSMCEASIDAMQARYTQARKKLEALNRSNPLNFSILKRLVMACEQERNYDDAAGFLRAALKVCPDDEKLLQKRKQYEILGKW
ncbi:protein kinase domain-containing protein [Parahaliea mediterranea]|uniref:protein kinase domain-containing protein n=1 Tax=Parahaliea mediterranea TaxID=651086 RepID=UPI000E2E7D78|nr:protein kinase [Parahaliea mediterranea]